MATSAKVLDARQFPSADRARPGKMDVLVTYEIAGTAQYSIVVPEELATRDGVQAAIAADVRRRQDLRGGEFTIE